jgi:hypothetical protein
MNMLNNVQIPGVRSVACARLASRSELKRVLTLEPEFGKMVTGRLLMVTLLCAGATAVYGQEMSPTAQPQQQQPITSVETGNNIPLYRIQVVGRDIPAINYWHRSGSTKIGFAGTSLLPQGKGEASVTSKGQTFIDAKFDGFVPPIASEWNT